MLLTRSGVEPIDPGEIPFVLSSYAQFQYVEIAVATALCYDTITTFDKEVKYFWSSPRKTTSIVYFLNRYIGIFAISTHVLYYSYHINTELCNFSTWAGDIGDWMTLALIDYILLLRVLALWSGAKTLALCLKTLFAVVSMFMLGIWLSIPVLEKISVGGAEGFAFCGHDIDMSPTLQTLYWLAALIFEFILMVLALYKAANLWRESAGVDGVSLVKVLIQDQALYFVLVMICGITRIAVFWVNPDNSPNAAANILQGLLISTAFPCIIGCRLLVHLNEAAERGVNGGTSYRVQSVNDMQFA